MAIKNRLIVPFFDGVIADLLCAIERDTGLKIGRHDIIVKAARYDENGRRREIWQGEDGRLFGLDDTVSLQAFSAVKSLEVIESRFENVAFGISFLGSFSLALVQIGDTSKINVLWNALNAFKTKARYGYKIDNPNGDQEFINGDILPRASVIWDITRIASEYFPDQLPQVEQRQLDIVGLEFKYQIRMENICTFCVETPS